MAHPSPIQTNMQYESRICNIDVVNDVIINPTLTDMEAPMTTFLGEKVLIKIVVNKPEKFKNKFVLFIIKAISFFDICNAYENKTPNKSPNTDIKDL